VRVHKALKVRKVLLDLQDQKDHKDLMERQVQLVLPGNQDLQERLMWAHKLVGGVIRIYMLLS
jgi:hypothetical protein